MARLNLPRCEFATVPTPVESLPELADRWDISDFCVKRDDRTSELYGGNKVRKLEYLLAQAKVRSKNSVWTLGGIGSHHALATSIFAREVNLQPKILHFEQPVTDHVRDILRALSSTDPELTLCGSIPELLTRMVLKKLSIQLGFNSDTYYLPAGGSRPEGVVGYYRAAEELLTQLQENSRPKPDVIFVPVGSGGTLAGLTLGLRNADCQARIIGIRVVNPWFVNSFFITRLANKTASWIEKHSDRSLDPVSSADYDLLGDYYGPGYGEMTPNQSELLDDLNERVPFRVDPTYTVKTLAGIRGEARRLNLESKTVLYWHTLNPVDLSDRIDTASKRDLPESYQKFFAESD